jgi:hypothetical protein
MKKKTEEPEPMGWREAVEFLLRLVTIEDPEQLRPGDRLNLLDDLRRYLDIEPGTTMADELAKVAGKPANLERVIEVARKLANAAADRERVEIPLSANTVIFDGKALGSKRWVYFLDGSLRDAMVNRVAADLIYSQPWQILRCVEGGCHKLFLAARKGQIYCSHRCANTAASREYRAKNASDRGDREESRRLKKKAASIDEPREA